MIYNKSRDVDRVCPSCHRIYRVGEAPRAYQDFQEFFERPKPDAEVDEKTMQEQDMSGICCGPCFNALSDKPWQANGCGAELAKMRDLASSNGFTIRPSRPEEQWESGLKIVWEKLGN